MQKTREADSDYRNGDWGVKYLMRGPRIDWGVILLPPGEAMGEHGHNEVEETFYFLSGKASMIVDGTPHDAEQGDAFRIEPPDRHDIVNCGKTPVKVVFIKQPYSPQDKT